jgi:hypothetical protein
MVNTGAPFEINFDDYRPDIVEPIIAGCSASKAVSQYSTPTCQYKAWTIAEIDDLVCMYDAGFHMRDICKELRRTSGGVIGKLTHLGKNNRL